MLHAHYNFDGTFRLFTKYLKRFLREIYVQKFKKFLGAFEKRADDVTFGGPISSPKFQKLFVNKNLKVRMTIPQKVKSFRRYLFVSIPVQNRVKMFRKTSERWR